jgi:hypothetical protein
MDPKVHYHILKSSPMDFILSHTNQIYPSYQIYLRSIFISSFTFVQVFSCLFSSGFLTKYFMVDLRFTLFRDAMSCSPIEAHKTMECHIPEEIILHIVTCISHLLSDIWQYKNANSKVLLTPIANICNAIRRTTVEQKCGGGTWPIRAAVADDTHSPTPVAAVSPTMRAWNIRYTIYLEYWVHSYAVSYVLILFNLFKY